MKAFTIPGPVVVSYEPRKNRPEPLHKLAVGDVQVIGYRDHDGAPGVSVFGGRLDDMSPEQARAIGIAMQAVAACVNHSGGGL